MTDASDYIASVTLPTLTPSITYAVAAVAAISVAAVAYQATKPVVSEFVLDSSSETSTCDDSVCSDTTVVSEEAVNDDVVREVTYIHYLVSQLNIAMLAISSYLSEFASALDDIMTKITEDISSIWNGMTELVVSTNRQNAVDANALECGTSSEAVDTSCNDTDCGCGHTLSHDLNSEEVDARRSV